MLLLKTWRWWIPLECEMSSLSDTLQVITCFYGLEHSPRIHGFRLTWPWLIVKVLVTQAKFLEPSGYNTVINCAFTFHATNVFGCFHDIMAKFELVKYKFPNYIFICTAFKSHTWSKAMHNMSAYQLASYDKNNSDCSNCFSHVIYMLQTKMYQNFAKFTLVHTLE